MLMVNQLIGFGAGGASESNLFTVIQGRGLTTGLFGVYDAGSISSWPGSGTKWLDLSGNGNDLFLGTDGSTNAPTFSGTPGRGSNAEYWSFNGSQFMRLAASNPAAINSIHKDGAVFTALCVLNFASGGFGICGTDGNSFTNVGFGYRMNSLVQKLQGASGSAATIEKSADNNESTGTWYCNMLSVTENGGGTGAFFARDGAYEQSGSANQWNPNYGAPSSSAATYTLEVGAQGNGQQAITNGSKIAAFALWTSAALTQANGSNIWSDFNTLRAYK